MKVLAGLSGGVDSSVALLLLRDAGHEVAGATMLLWREGRYRGGARDACFGPGERKDAEEAAALCAKLGVPYRTFDCADAYEELVIRPWRAAFLAGKTPNPCVRCNAALKFGALPELARAAGTEFDAFATGHYARVERGPDGRMRLLRAVDRSRDQSYFLYRLSQEQLARQLFPLGGLSKAEVRRIARERGLLEVADKPDSQDFYSGERDELIGEPDRPGDIVDEAGRVLGRHSGFWKYTVGQRRGLALANPSGTADGEPLYVLGVDACTNCVTVGPKPATVRGEFSAGDCNWISRPAPEPGERFACSVKIRSVGDPVPGATVEALPDGAVRVRVEGGLAGVAPGQSAVFYEGDVLLGGGFIGRG